MKKRIKKGFTLVELLVVIAILAILSTVAIVGYNSFTEKARISNDKGLVTQLNTLLQADEVTDGKAATPSDALAVVAENGFDVSKMTPTADDYHIVWNEETNRFVLLDENKVAVVEELSSSAHKNWQFSSAYTPLVTGYSVRLNDNFVGTSLEVTSGLDVGNNTGIELVTYSGTADVVIRTNGESLTVNSGSVTHYGVGYILTVADSAKANYVEKGTFAANAEEIENVGSNVSEYTYVSNADELTQALAESKAKIALSANITSEYDIGNATSNYYNFVVSADTEINMNGYNIDVKHILPLSVNGINNIGAIQVKNCTVVFSGAGRLSLTATGNNFGWSLGSKVLELQSDSNVTINSGVLVQHFGGTDMAYGIDMLNSNGGQVLNINGGLVRSNNYIGIRLFNNAQAENKVSTINVNDGIVEGPSRDIWVQNPSDKVFDANGVVNISDSYTFNMVYQSNYSGTDLPKGRNYYID